MEPSLQKQSKVVVKEARSAARFVWSFVWMVLFTVVAFYLVAYPQFSATTTFYLILTAGLIQAVLQLFTFMHLNEKGHVLPIIFMGMGFIIAVLTVVGLLTM